MTEHRTAQQGCPSSCLYFCRSGDEPSNSSGAVLLMLVLPGQLAGASSAWVATEVSLRCCWVVSAGCCSPALKTNRKGLASLIKAALLVADDKPSDSSDAVLLMPVLPMQLAGESSPWVASEVSLCWSWVVCSGCCIPALKTNKNGLASLVKVALLVADVDVIAVARKEEAQNNGGASSSRAQERVRKTLKPSPLPGGLARGIDRVVVT